MQPFGVRGLSLLLVLLAACGSDNTKECKEQPGGTKCADDSSTRKCEEQPDDAECEGGSSMKKCEGPGGTECEDGSSICYEGSCRKQSEVPCERGGTSCGLGPNLVCNKNAGEREGVCMRVDKFICLGKPEGAECGDGNSFCKEGDCIINCTAETQIDFCARMAEQGLVCGEVTDKDDCGHSRTVNCGEGACPNGCSANNTCM